MDAYEIADGLHLQTITRRWRVQECSAQLGQGVEQAFDWLCSEYSGNPHRN